MLIFVHQYFAPEVAGSAQQLADLVAGLSERGYSIQVVTGQPSYSTRAKLPTQENFHGVGVHRLPKIQLARAEPTGRILSALSFFFAAFLKLLFMERKAILVIGSDPPFLSLLGWFFHFIRGQRYLLIVSDIYPEVATALGKLSSDGLIAKALAFSNRLAYGKAEKIVVLGEKMAECIEAKLLQEREQRKIEIIHNWADENLFYPLHKSENHFSLQHHLENKFVILFSGNLGHIYDFKEVLDAAALFNGSDSVEFLFIGEGPCREKLESQVAQKCLRNVRLLPYQPPEMLPYSLACGDLAVVPLRREVTGLCIPGKFYYALAAGLPVLVIASSDSEPAQIVQQNDCGWVVPPGHTDEIVLLLKELSKNPSLLEEKKKKARACFEAHFTKARALRQYESLFSGF